MSGIQPPRFSNTGAVILTDEQTARVRRYVANCGTDTEARRRLGVSADTLIALCYRGTMLRRTRDRVLARLDECDREVAA